MRLSLSLALSPFLPTYSLAPGDVSFVALLNLRSRQLLMREGSFGTASKPSLNKPQGGAELGSQGGIRENNGGGSGTSSVNPDEVIPCDGALDEGGHSASSVVVEMVDLAEPPLAATVGSAVIDDYDDEDGNFHELIEEEQTA